jgi:hypothetical protein
MLGRTSLFEVIPPQLRALLLRALVIGGFLSALP